MGMLMSVMGMGKAGMPSAQMFNILTDNLYKQFIEEDVSSFEDFHSAILDMFNIINSALPGKHYVVPSLKEIKDCFTTWQESVESERKEVFVNFMQDRVNISKPNDYTVIIGIMTPLAAMAAKKAVENVPQMRIIKAIPAVISVLSISVLALILAKLSRKMIQAKSAS